MGKIIVVNEQDKPADLKSFDELHYEDIYRVSALWLTDKNTGDCLVTQRKWNKQHDPGKWMAAASGTVDEGESYRENMVKEIEEEIGLANLALTEGPKKYVDDGKHKFFVQWFTAQVDKDKVTIIIQEEEVEAYAWIAKEKLLKDVATTPNKYVPSMQSTLKILGVSWASGGERVGWAWQICMHSIHCIHNEYSIYY